LEELGKKNHWMRDWRWPRHESESRGSHWSHRRIWEVSVHRMWERMYVCTWTF